MKLTWILAILIISFYLPAAGQLSAIQGTVVDIHKNAMNGNALLFNTTGEQFLQGDFFENGTLRLTVDSFGTYVLRISCLGYAEDSISLAVRAGTAMVEIGEIVLNEVSTTLEQVTVTARRSMFERTADGTKINVEKTLLAKSVSAVELLSKSPGVSIAANKINTFGRGEAVVYLDGKEIQFETFKSLPPIEIKSLEIITNPSAKYDAKGKAVILVSMKKSYQQGLSATLMENATWGIHLMNSANLSLNLKKKKLSLSTYYANDLGTNWSDNRNNTLIKSEAGTYTTRSFYREDSRSTDVHTYRLGLGYPISEKGDLSIQYDGLFHYFDLAVQQNSDYYVPTGEKTLIDMRNAATTRLFNHSGNINYSLQTDTMGSNFFWGTQYNRFENQLLDHITETISPPDHRISRSQRINDGRNLIRLFASQVDITRVWKKNHRLEWGAKYAHITNEGNIRFYSKAEGNEEFIEYPQYANGTIYVEKMPAIYALINGNRGKWNYQAGLRAEYTFAQGFSNKLDRFLIDSTYFNFFPSAKVNYRINDEWTSSLSIARKINRPCTRTWIHFCGTSIP